MWLAMDSGVIAPDLEGAVVGCQPAVDNPSVTSIRLSPSEKRRGVSPTQYPAWNSRRMVAKFNNLRAHEHLAVAVKRH